MKTGKKLISIFLVLASLIGVIPVSAPAAEAAGTSIAATSTETASGITITQTARWDPSVSGETAVNVTVQVFSDEMMQETPRDVVILIDHSALQPLESWQHSAVELVDILKEKAPETRFALVSYASTAETLLDFTADQAQVKSAVESIASGGNSNAYAGFLEVQKLLRTASANSCVVFFSTGVFNMNIDRTLPLIEQVQTSVPIYGYNYGHGTSHFWQYRHLISYQYNIRELALIITDSPLYTDLTVTARLDTDNFLPTKASSSAGNYMEGALTYQDGVLTFQPHTFRMGQSFTIFFSGKLTDRTKVNTVPVAQEASITAAGLSVETGGVSLERNGHTVTYNGNGADNTVECPPPRGQWCLWQRR